MLRTTPTPDKKRRVTAVSTLPNDESDPAPVNPPGVEPRERSVLPTMGGIATPIRLGLSKIPPLPHVIRELLRELGDPASNARSVARIAATDPALAAGLIRTVNSAAMGLRKKVTSVADAVSFLGYTTVRSLVIRTRLEKIFPAHGLQSVYDAEDLWVHSLAVSYAAEALAQRLPEVDRGFVATLGLLHDIGKLAINSYFPHSGARLRVRSAEHPGESFLDRERRVLGGDHAEIGAALAQHWGLPTELSEAIRWHHAPQEMPRALGDAHRSATVLVHVANQLAKYCYLYSEDMEVDIVPAELLREAGLPGPLARLLNTPVRRAISRAVFFADENTAGGSGRPLRMVRRFICLPARGEAPLEAPAPVFGRPYITLADRDWDLYFPPEPLRVDDPAAPKLRLERALASLGDHARFRASATQQGIEQLQSIAIGYLDRLPAEDAAASPVRFLLRRLLTNLADIGPGEAIEVAVGLSDRQLTLGVRCPALQFARRFGSHVAPRLAQAALVRELANVLNLRWFSRIQTSQDGSLLLFHVAEAREAARREVLVP